MTYRFTRIIALLTATLITAPAAYAQEPLFAPAPAPQISPFVTPTSAPSPRDVLDFHEEGDVPYVTGGIGEDERRAMESVRPNYNLHIMSAGKSGAFAGDTLLIIRNKDGLELLRTDAGPLFYAKLQPGKYSVEGSNNGQVRSQNITVGKTGSSHIHFTWKDDGEVTAKY